MGAGDPYAGLRPQPTTRTVEEVTNASRKVGYHFRTDEEHGAVVIFLVGSCVGLIPIGEEDGLVHVTYVETFPPSGDTVLEPRFANAQGEVPPGYPPDCHRVILRKLNLYPTKPDEVSRP